MSDGSRRAMTPEALCNALDTCARAVRRIVFQAIDCGRRDLVTDIQNARSEIDGFMDYAQRVVEARCGPVEEDNGEDV